MSYARHLGILVVVAFVPLVISQFSGTTDDCNSVDRCPPVEIVFVVDTSASMVEEAVSLCETIEGVVSNVSETLSISVDFTIMGIARYGQYHGTAGQFQGAAYPCPGPEFYDDGTSCNASVPPELCPQICPQNNVSRRFSCLSSDVETLYYEKGLSQIPGNSSCVWPMPSTCAYNGSSSTSPTDVSLSCQGCYTKASCRSEGAPLGVDNQGETECWGAASTVVVEHFDWETNSLKIVVPVSDEGPCNGGNNGQGVCLSGVEDAWNFHGAPTCCNSTVDTSDVQNLIALAREDQVIVSPITADADSATIECIDAYSREIANQTGGFTGATTGSDIGDLSAQMTTIVTQIITDACNKFVWSCDDKDPCTIRETCQFSDVNGTESVECLGICICDNNCEDVSSFSVPEDDIDVVQGGDGDDATAIGAGVGAGVVGLLLLIALAVLLVCGILVIAGVLITAVVLSATGVTGSGANLVAQAFVENGASFNPLYAETAGSGTNPLFEQQ